MIQNKFYNWYAGNHCYPKCSLEKVAECRLKIKKLLENNLINAHRDFVNLVRYKHKICGLSIAE